MYLYAEATDNANRKSLPYIRQGEYELLPEKVNTYKRKFHCLLSVVNFIFRKAFKNSVDKTLILKKL